MKRHIRLLLLLLTAMLLCGFRAQALVGMSAFIVDTDSNDSADNYIPIPAVYEVYRTIKNLFPAIKSDEGNIAKHTALEDAKAQMRGLRSFYVKLYGARKAGKIEF